VLDEAVVEVLHHGEARDAREVGHHQRQGLRPAHALHRVERVDGALLRDGAAEAVDGVGGVGDRTRPTGATWNGAGDLAGLGVLGADLDAHVRHPAFGKVPRGYYRMTGPAGYKSRYEDPPLATVADVITRTQSAECLAVFANVDMYADAKRLRKLMER
jgi:hypothetical protein